jgi:hypothetical protein
MFNRMATRIGNWYRLAIGRHYSRCVGCGRIRRIRNLYFGNHGQCPPF